MRQIAGLLILVTCAAVAAACDDPTPSIGVRVTSQGELMILWNPCHESRMAKSVELKSSGKVISRIESEEGSPRREFTVGVAPEGFSTSVPLAVDLIGIRLLPKVSGVGVYVL